jgi:hypothetical protein
LEPEALRVGVPSPAGQEWYELLRHKLLAQVEMPPALVVAVMGGTNIGKSVIFNHLAGEDASSVSPLAAGTKHPVCLVPKNWASEAALVRLFEGFELRAWHSPTDALTSSAEHFLFWRVGAAVPERLLLLDTPDIDSDAEINWQRADIIRQSADVLIAVLTQQKYNDAAVKRFFRKAAEADKPVIVVFNQCDLEDDRAIWPSWLETFTSETGVHPTLVYVVPYDRTAARTNLLPFYTVGSDGKSPPQGPANLRAELGALHFDEIKVRTFRGALRGVLDRETGVGHWLDQVRTASGGFAAAARSLSATEMAQVNWPVVPASILVDEIRHWWDDHRSPWSKSVNGFYGTAIRGLLYPIKAARNALGHEPSDPLVAFHAQERAAILAAIGHLISQLERLSQVGNEMLRPRLATLLAGERRAKLLERVEKAHDELPAVGEAYRTYLREELSRWGHDNPRAISFLRSLDHVAAIARPAITVSLAVSGGLLAGDVVGQAATHVASQTMGHLAAEAAITGGFTVGGEAIVSATGEGIRQTSARLFRRLQTRYAELRASWLAEWLERELLGELLSELHAGAVVAQSTAMRTCDEALASLAVGSRQ